MKILFTLVLLLTISYCFAQMTKTIKNIPHAQRKATTKDTVIESDTSKENKEPRYFYISGNLNAFVNTKGGFAKRFSPSVEFGRTYGIFDIGMATGRINSLSSGGDTARYIEFRP